MQELFSIENDIDLLKSRMQMKFSSVYDEASEEEDISPFNLMMRIRNIEKQMQALERDIATVNRAKKDLLRSINYAKPNDQNTNENGSNKMININNFIGQETSKHLARNQIDSFTNKINNLNKVLTHLTQSSSSYPHSPDKQYLSE